jgi:transposase/DNA-binding CsgD family transcriptional regulator
VFFSRLCAAQSGSLGQPLNMAATRYNLAEISPLLDTPDDREKFIVLQAAYSGKLTGAQFNSLCSQMPIGTSRNRVLGLVCAVRMNRYMWFSWEVNKLRTLFEAGQTDQQIADDMALSAYSIAYRRTRLGLSRDRDKSQTLTRQALAACIEQNFTLAQAATKFAVCENTISTYCRRYELSFNKTGSNHPNSLISHYDRALICALHDLGFYACHIDKAIDIPLFRIQAVLFNAPSADYVDPYECPYGKVQQLLSGTLKSVQYFYTPAQIDLIKSLPLEEVAKLTGRSLNSVEKKQAKMLATLIRQGLDDTQISEQMCCAISTVHKLRKGMEAKKIGKRPVVEIKKVLQACIAENKTKQDAAEKLQVNCKTIEEYCRRFGLAFVKPPSNITLYNWRLICTLHRMGFQPQKIALAVPVHLVSIKNAVYHRPTQEAVDPHQSPYVRVSQLLNGTLQPVVGVYTTAELAILRDHPVEEASVLTGRPVQALLHKLSLLHSERQSTKQRPANKNKAQPRLYTKQEIELLQTSSIEQVAAVTGRTVTALKSKKRQLAALTSVTQTGQQNKGVVGTGKRYCLEDMQPLLETEEDKAKFAVMTCIYACSVDNIYIDELCLELGLSNAQLIGTVSAICRNMHLWFSWEDDELAKLFHQGVRDQQIGQRMGLSTNSVINRRTKLGLKQ